MKKKLLVAVMALTVSASAFAFAACGEDDGVKPSAPKLTYVSAKDSTCVEDGNLEYWTDGTKYFSDEKGKTEVRYDSLVVGKKPHTVGAMTFDGTGHWHYCAYTEKGNHDYTDAEGNVDKQNHTLGDWIYDPAPTETTAGKKYKECFADGCDYATEKETAPATGGGEQSVLTRVPAADSTCIEQGNIEYWTDGVKFYSDADGNNEITEEQTKLPLSAHTVGAMTFDDTGHWHYCAYTEKGNHDYTDAEGNVDKQNHTLGDWVYDKQPTAQEEGERHKECTTEGCDYATEPETVPVLDTVVYHPANDATCTKDGNVEYWEKNGVCYSDEACTQEISDDDRIIEATGHEMTPRRDETVHWQECSKCDFETERAAHVYTDIITEPTCEECGKTSHACDCGYAYDDGVTEALGHSNTVSAFVVDESAPHGGLFVKACSRCGEPSAEAAVPGAPAEAYSDRTVTINGTTFGAYTCYTDAELKDKGVTFDALANDGLFVIDATAFAGQSLSVAAGNTAVVVVVKGETALTNLKFTEGWKAAYIRGDGELKLSKLESVASTLYIETAVSVDAPSDNGTELHNTHIKGGTLSVVAPRNNGGTGINLGENKQIIVDDGSSLYVKGFINGIFGNKSALTVNGGSAVISAQKHGTAGINVAANGGSLYIKSEQHHTVASGWEEQGEVHTFTVGGDAEVTVESTYVSGGNIAAFNKMNVIVNGGTLIVKAPCGIKESAVTLSSGKLTLLATSVGNNSAFNSISAITIADGFDLGVKDYARLVTGEPNVDVAENVSITTENIADYTYPTDGEAEYADALEKYCVRGAVTPADVTIPSVSR